MTEAPKRIGICPIHKTWHRDPHETDWNYIRADLMESKLVKALEALRRIANSQPRPMRSGGYEGHDVSNMQRTARATLAEIDGDKT